MDDLFQTLTLSNGGLLPPVHRSCPFSAWHAAPVSSVTKTLTRCPGKFLCSLLPVSGDALGTAMDILGSDWSNSSDWSGSVDHAHQRDVYPFLELDKEKSERSPVPHLASVSELTNITITGGSAVTGSSSFGQGSGMPHPESTCCSPVSLDTPPTGQHTPHLQLPRHPVELCDDPDELCDDHDGAASDFSRSSSSNWSHNDESQPPAKGSNRLHLSELIGRGAFGSVYRGSWKGKQAAIKVSYACCRSTCRQALHIPVLVVNPVAGLCLLSAIGRRA